MSRATIFALKRAQQATQKVLDNRLATYGLTAAQLDILLLLEKRGESTQRDLQAALGITSATLTRILDGMVANGLVERHDSQHDGRVKCVISTPHAETVLCRLQEEEEPDFLAQFTADFSAAELRILTGWLFRLANNMGDTSEAIFGYGAEDPKKEKCNEFHRQTI